jgi:imidazolonepropionase-like amidohydrolase/Tol biopolymer transport system component
MNRALHIVALSLAIAGAVQAQGPDKRPKPPLPLEAARKSSFTATRGTWISLDVSPDGKTIVFDLLGDLYTMPIEGGRATAITGGMAYDAQPRFSPDGKSIAFISDRSGGDNLWTMRLDFTDTTQVSQGNNGLYVSPEWSPDGQFIAVSHSTGLGGAAKIEMFRVGHHDGMALVRGSTTFKTLGAAFSPDGRYVWYSGRAGDWAYNALFPQTELYRYDREEGTSTLMTSRYGSGFRPAISPDGNWLVYGTREGAQTGLRLRDLNTGDEDWLAYPVQRDEMESRAPLDFLPGYSFTPDSKAIVVSYGGEIWRVPVDHGAASKIPFEAPVKLEIGPEVNFSYRVDTTANVVARQVRSPVMSPDNKWLAFTAFDRMYIKPMPAGNARRVDSADVGEYHPTWSPDGRWLAYVSWDDTAGGHIWKAAADGRTPPVRLTRVAALYYNLAWSPDGQRIVATRGAARDLKEVSGTFNGPLGGEFIWISSAGGDVNLIAPTGDRDVAHFRLDQPERIYAYSPSEGLVSFRWDGSNVKRHLQVTGQPAPGGSASIDPDEVEFLPRRFARVRNDTGSDLEQNRRPPPAGLVMMSPRGGRALAQVGSHIYTVEIPEIGGPVPSIMATSGDGGPTRVRKLTDVGGEFPSWSADGNTVRWGIGNALLTYDLTRAEAIDDSVEQAGRDRVGRALRVRAVNDSLKSTRALIDSLTKAKVAIADSIKTKLNARIADSVRINADLLLAQSDSIKAKAQAVIAMADSVRANGVDTLKDSTRLYQPAETRIIVPLARDVPRGVVVLHGGRVVTMKGHEIIDTADVVVQDNRIIAVGKAGTVTIPAGAQVIDVTGKTVIPGFVDTHYHAQWLVPEIHPRQAWQYLANLAFGVTTMRDPQTGSTDILSYQDRVETGGMIGPRIYSTGPGVFAGENIASLDQAKSILKRYSNYYGTNTLKMYMTGNRQQRQWIIQAARELKLMPTTEGGLDFKLDMTHVIDGYPGVEHSLPIDPIFDDVIKLFRASQTTNTPTLLVSYGGPFGENYFYAKEEVHDNPMLRRFVPEDNLDRKSRRRGPGAGGSPGQAGWFLDEEYVFKGHADYARRLVLDSARAAIGSHGQLQGLGYHWELWAMSMGGASNHDVLRMATIYGAEAIGMGQDLGTIEPGKMADILVLDQDPLANLRNTISLHYVMKNGRLYEAATLDEVWPRKRTLPPQFHTMNPTGVSAGIR